MRLHDDQVEVRRDAIADPEQFLWQGRLWQVREVVSHWVDAGSWWSAPEAVLPAARDEREVWRVSAALGRDGDRGVFDLALSWADGDWRLTRAAD